ncbi:MAG: tetratricopeptide repeat protein [Flavobacteriaceae bacterium]
MSPNTNITQEQLEFIERCLNKTATSEELQAFNERLKNDKEFEVQVTDIKTLLLGIESQALKEKLNTFHEELLDNTNNKVAPVKFLHFKKIAAAAILVIALGSFWFLSGNKNEKLYTKYFSPDPGLPTLMSENQNFVFYDAMVDYKQGEYKKAILKWEPLLKNSSKNDTLNYFLGMAQLANKQETKAIEYLQVVTNLDASAFKNEAYYYLGLAYLKANNVELAKKNLTFSTVDNSKKILTELYD